MLLVTIWIGLPSGKYGLMQCSKHIVHAKTYQDEALMRRLAVEQENMKLTTGLFHYVRNIDCAT